MYMALLEDDQVASTIKGARCFTGSVSATGSDALQIRSRSGRAERIPLLEGSQSEVGMAAKTGKWRDLFLVVILAAIAGATEGLAYSEPPNPYMYWLLGGIGIVIIGYFAFDETPILAIATVPLFIVVQDAVSYLVMFRDFPPTWYPAYFPDSFLWDPIPVLNVPTFYVVFVAASLVVFAAVKVRLSGERAP